MAVAVASGDRALHASVWGRGRMLGRCLMALMVLLVAACAGPTVQERQVPGQPVLGPQPAPGPVPMTALGQPQSITDRLGRPVAPDAVRVGLLLPLSGQAGDLGRQMRQAAEMAVLDIGTPNFQLLPRDTGGTVAGARQAADAVLNEGAQLILGPLFSPNVGPVAEVARARGVNVVAFTTDASVAGGNALVMGFVPEAQVQRVVEYSARQGLNRFAVLAPDTPYGNAVASATRQAVQRQGGSLVDTVMYNPNGTEFSAEVQRLAAAGGVQAVMLPDTGLRLRTVAPLLPYYGLREAQIIGTGLWDGGNVGVERAMRGALFASPQPNLRADFERRYQQNFGAPPPRLATLAYDAVAMAAILSQIPERATYDLASLADPDGFAGVDGIFRFGSDNVVDRGLAILQVTDGGSRVVEAAPETFVGFGF